MRMRHDCPCVVQSSCVAILAQAPWWRGPLSKAAACTFRCSPSLAANPICVHPPSAAIAVAMVNVGGRRLSKKAKVVSGLSKKDQKETKKAEAKFVVSASKIFETGSHDDLVYCKEQLDAHPQWIPYLTKLIKRGMFEQLVKTVAEEAAEEEKSRIFGTEKLPTRQKSVNGTTMKVIDTFLRAVNGTLVPEKISDEVKSRMFNYALQLSDTRVSLPPSPDFCYVRMYVKFLVELYMHLGKRLHKSFKDVDLDEESFSVWVLDEETNTVTFRATSEEHTFAFMGDKKMDWEIEDIYTINTSMTSPSLPGAVVSLASQFTIPEVTDLTSNITIESSETKFTEMSRERNLFDEPAK